MLLGSAEVGMNQAGTTAKTSHNNVMILTEAPCLCASSTLAKFQVFAVASFCCGTHMGVGILGSEYWGLNTGVGVTGVGCYLGSAVTGVGCWPCWGRNIGVQVLGSVLLGSDWYWGQLLGSEGGLHTGLI